VTHHGVNELPFLRLLPLAVIPLTLAVCLTELPAPVSAQTGSAIGQSLVAALPQLGDLPTGYEFKSESAGLHDLSAGTAGSYAGWVGKRAYTWYVPSTHYNASSADFIRIPVYCNYSEGINDPDANSPEKFRALHMTWDNKGKNSAPYDGLPGGVIVNTVEEDSNGAHLFARIYFWKSRYYRGDIYIQYNVTRSNNNHPETPPYASRLAEGKSFYLTHIDRLAKLMYSRLPEGPTGSPRSTLAAIPPTEPPATQSAQSAQPVESVQLVPSGQPVQPVQLVPSGQAEQSVQFGHSVQTGQSEQSEQRQPPDNAGTSGGQDRVPDTALPAAVGATAVVAGLGALAVAFANGQGPKEAVEQLVDLLRGRYTEVVEPVAVETSVQTTFDQASYERMMRDENQRQLQDDVNRAKDAVDRRQQYIDGLRQAGQAEQASREASTLGELRRELSRTQQQLSDSGGHEAEHIVKQNVFDIREDQGVRAREDVAAAQAGTLSDLDRVKLDDWIDMQAPDEQAAERMRTMIEERTLTTSDGKTVGSFEGISRELGQMLQGSNQPELSYVERFSIRDEFMDNAKTFGDVRGKAQDAAALKGGLADIAGKISDGVGYVEGYTKGAGDSAGYAVVKAAAQMGIKQVVFQNPVIGMGDTAFKYAENAVLGRDASPGKAVETMVTIAFEAAQDVKDRAPVTFNPASGRFEMGASTLGADSPDLTEPAARSMLSAVDQQLRNPNLSAADRDGLSVAREDLMETLNEIRGR
jgi:hypothetical protein